MTDWREAAAARRKSIVPQAKIAKTAKSGPLERGGGGFGSFGNFGTAKSAEAGGLRSASYLAEESEQAAIVGEGGHFEIVEADGFDAAHFVAEPVVDLAFTHAQTIRAELARLPQPYSLSGYRLLNRTRLFLCSPKFERSLKLGWSLEELFGVGPNASLESPVALGLIPALALPLWPHRLERIEADRAIISAQNERPQSIERLRAELEGAELWWRNEQLVLWD